MREFKNEVSQQRSVCVYALVCVGGIVVLCLSEPQLLRLSAGSAGYLWKALFENKIRTKVVGFWFFFFMNQRLNFYKIISTEV